jgi:TolB-like protein/Flp pilus assembly protein TadD
VSEGAGDGSGRATGVEPGALSALLQEVAAAPELPEAELVALPPGTVVGRFEIVRELGRGGFGVVYEAKDRDLGRRVAVKIVRPGRIVEEEGRISREAEAIARLAHPNLVTLHEVGRSEGRPFLVFELLRGKTLDLRIEEGPLPVQEAVHIATEVARGLAHAHAEGVIHRDLKPANVFVTNKGPVKILDFGMAHAFGRKRLSGGTPAYMAPEQWEDAPEDERTDVFALGVMLYRMLTGEYPFPEGRGKWSSEPAALRKLDVPGAPELAELVERMLDPIPTRRPRDGAAVLSALQAIDDGLRARPADGKPPEHARRRKATFGDLLAELKRRHVFRVMVGYGIFAFAVLQVTEPVLHAYDLPAWALTAVVTALAVGFPVAVVLAWIYDLTAQGVKRTPSASGIPLSRRARVLMPLSVALAVLALAVAGGGAWFAWKRIGEPRRDPGASGGRPSIAVLPFADLSPGHDQGYLADGVAEEVLNGLAQVDGLSVVGRTTAFSYRGKDKKVEEIGRELGVGAVLEGSVRSSGDRIRVQAQLVQTSNAATLWSQSFERSLSDVFALQDEIGRAVVEALAVRLLPGRSSARAGGTTDAVALQSYLRGRDLLRRGGPESPKAWQAFEKAVSADPRFALAWVGIADALVTIESTMGDMEGNPAARRRRAREAADRAVALAPGSPDAFRARADVHQWLESDWRGQREDLDKALALSPGDPAVALSRGFALQASGDIDAAIAEFSRVTRIDPLLSTGWLNGWLALGAAQVSRGDLEAGTASLHRALDLFPTFCEPRWGLGMGLIAAGKPAEALEEAGRIRKACAGPGYAVSLEALALHDLGKPVEARAALDQVIQGWGNNGGDYQVAEIYAWTGEKDRAFEWLEKARVNKDTAMFWLKTDPLLRKVRGDRRWTELLRRANLPLDGPAAVDAAAPTPSAEAIPSIAVLPFADMSPKRDQEYFADGVAEEILNALVHVDGLKVIGRTSSFSFKGKPDDLKTIGEKLGASAVLEGSVRREGNRLRVTAQIARAADGTQLWSQTFDRNFSGIFEIQGEIARAVVQALKVNRVASRATSPPGRPTASDEAYLLLLSSRKALASGTPDGRRQAAKALERAVALDPGYAAAWAGLSHALRMRSEDASAAAELAELRHGAADATGKALALDPNLATAYVQRSQDRTWVLDWDGARADADRARSLDPTCLAIGAWRAVLEDAVGSPAGFLVVARAQVEADPLNAGAWYGLGWALVRNGRLSEARSALRRSLDFAPGSPDTRYWLAMVHLLGHEPERALQVAEEIPAESGLRPVAVAMAQQSLGRSADSQATLQELVARWGHNAAYNVAQVYAWRGEPGPAFEWLDRALVQRDSAAPWLRNDPTLWNLHADPRWKPFLRKMNLPAD